MLREIINTFLINTLIIITPIFIIQSLFFLKKGDLFKKSYSKKVIGSITLFVPILCMMFPVETTQNLQLDLRGIPISFATLYGGPLYGFLALVIATAYRGMLTMTSFHSALFNLLLIFLVTCAVRRMYVTGTYLHKFFIVGVLSIVLSVLASIISTMLNEDFPFQLSSPVYISFMVISFFTSLITVLLIETLQESIRVYSSFVRSEKLQVVSELAASISHEVRNPLTVTKGFIQLLKSDDIEPHKKSEFIALAEQELDRANQIISNYLSFARPAPEKEEIIQLDSEICFIHQVIEPYAMTSNIETKVNIPANRDWMMVGEKQKLQQSFLNITKNAIEAMPHGGTLSIEAETTPTSLIVNFRDTGIGMTEETINRLGEPYFSTREKGTGLGMMVTFSIIRGMKGKIEIDSMPGKGTTMKVTFPKAKG